MVKNNEVQRQRVFKTIRRPTVNYEKNGVKLNKFSLKNLLETHHPGILLNLIFIINNFKH